MQMIKAANRLQPDVIVFDPARRGQLALDFVAELHAAAPESRLVVFTAVFEPRSFIGAMLQGVNAYLLKRPSDSISFLVWAIEGVGREGAIIIDPAVGERLQAYPRTRMTVHVPDPAGTSLTRRETEILVLALSGQTDDEIARQLQIGRVTAETHIRNIMIKLAVRTRTQLGVVADRAGLADDWTSIG